MDAERPLEASLEAIGDLEVDEVADAIETIGFECTRCGVCCRGYGDESHVATVFPEEVRAITNTHEYDWRDVVRPMPFGLADDGTGETIEWSLATDECGDCRFLESTEEGATNCTIYADRPTICRTYPFSLADSPGGTPMGSPQERVGPVVAHECEGLGRSIERDEAERLAKELIDRTIGALHEAMDVRGHLKGSLPTEESTVVIDSEGYKRPDGSLVHSPSEGQR